MPPVDWTRLAPHRPWMPKDPGYVPRPDQGSSKLVSLIRAGANPVAVVGAMGVGKSTELAAATRALFLSNACVPTMCGFDHIVAEVESQKTHVPGVPFLAASLPDILLNEKAAIVLTITCLVKGASRQDLVLSSVLEERMRKAHVLGRPDDLRLDVSLAESSDLLRETIREYRRASGGKQIILLFDGLEKCSADKAREILTAILPFRSEATLVLVVPTALVTGPASYDVVSTFKLFAIRPVPVWKEDGVPWQEGRQFLKSIVYRRLEMDLPGPPGLDAVLDRAAEASGGIPRVFLQLVLDAATYARLAEREMPTMDDLRDAMSDHTESLRRLLNKGDVAALREADGTDGLEVDPERRIRFLAHGLLLEYKIGDRIIVHSVPLLAGILARSAA